MGNALVLPHFKRQNELTCVVRAPFGQRRHQGRATTELANFSNYRLAAMFSQVKVELRNALCPVHHDAVQGLRHMLAPGLMFLIRG